METLEPWFLTAHLAPLEKGQLLSREDVRVVWALFLGAVVPHTER